MQNARFIKQKTDELKPSKHRNLFVNTMWVQKPQTKSYALKKSFVIHRIWQVLCLTPNRGELELERMKQGKRTKTKPIKHLNKHYTKEYIPVSNNHRQMKSTYSSSRESKLKSLWDASIFTWYV